MKIPQISASMDSKGSIQAKQASVDSSNTTLRNGCSTGDKKAKRFAMALVVSVVLLGGVIATRPFKHTELTTCLWVLSGVGESFSPTADDRSFCEKDELEAECRGLTMSYRSDLAHTCLPECEDKFGVIDGYSSTLIICGPLLYRYDKRTFKITESDLTQELDKRLGSLSQPASGEPMQHFIMNIGEVSASYAMRVWWLGAESTDIYAGCSGDECEVQDDEANSRAWILSAHLSQGEMASVYHYRGFHSRQSADILNVGRAYHSPGADWVTYGIHTSSNVTNHENYSTPGTGCVWGDFTQEGCTTAGGVIFIDSPCASFSPDGCNSTYETSCVQATSANYTIVQCTANLINVVDSTSFSYAQFDIA